MKRDNIIEQVGNTPILLYKKDKYKSMYLKLEAYNPSGSVKDRIAKFMLMEAEQSGYLTKEKTIIEATSGNTGISLAMIGGSMGYNVEIVMCKNTTIERKKMIEGYGAKLIYAEGNTTDDAIIKLNEMIISDSEKYFCPNQFESINNPKSHLSTAFEILQDLPNVKHVVSAVGTGGTIMGLDMAFKSMKRNVFLTMAKPKDKHYIDGLRNYNIDKQPWFYNEDSVSNIIEVTREEAITESKRVMKEHGIFVGISSGASIVAANELYNLIDNGDIVVICPDGGSKYLSCEE